jgi:hypothetical protein
LSIQESNSRSVISSGSVCFSRSSSFSPIFITSIQTKKPSLKLCSPERGLDCLNLPLWFRLSHPTQMSEV